MDRETAMKINSQKASTFIYAGKVQLMGCLSLIF
jgi:hypothetical protein